MRLTPENSPQQAVTHFLALWKRGSKDALDLLTPIVYQELRRLAAHYLRDERTAATLQPTALVHEAYMRLVAQSMPDWESRSHFFGVAAQLMRQILVDHSRRQKSIKRGKGAEKLSLDEVAIFVPAPCRDIEALDDALNALAAVDSRKAKVIELRFFGGFSVEETAQVLGISSATVGREQRLAEAWLYRQIIAGMATEHTSSALPS